MELPLVQRLKKEVEELRHELNTKLPKELQAAREHGDLRENAEYEAAKERQGIVNARIGAMEQRIRELSMINVRSFPKGVIGYGSFVTLADEEDGGEVRYEIVFPEEVDASHGKISLSSPLGRALLNRQPGDDVQVKTPKGMRSFSVLDLVTIHERDDISLE